MSKTLDIAVGQMCSGVSPGPNLEVIEKLARQAAARGADYLLFPEMAVAFAESVDQLARVSQSFEENEALAVCAKIARDNGIFLHVGSLAVLLEGPRFANRSVLFDRAGKLVDFYDKIHLFDAELEGERPYRESDNYRAGNRLVTCALEGAVLGMSICYDLRFAALFRRLAQSGADLISLPAAFTVPTGEAHWEVLVRARAIETGCYVAASAQGGMHENGRQTYGHSMIVDPWGKVLACLAGDSQGLIMAKIDPERVRQARNSVPALRNNILEENADFCVSVNHVGLKNNP